MRITVTGATGMVGSRVTTEAVARGHRITAVSPRLPTQPFPVSVTALIGCLASASALDASFADRRCGRRQCPPGVGRRSGGNAARNSGTENQAVVIAMTQKPTLLATNHGRGSSMPAAAPACLVSATRVSLSPCPSISPCPCHLK